MSARPGCGCGWWGLLVVGILWDLAFGGRFLGRAERCAQRGAAPGGWSSRGRRNVKCLASAVNFLRNGGGHDACLVSGRWLGSRGELPTVNRQLTGSILIVEACESSSLSRVRDVVV